MPLNNQPKCTLNPAIRANRLRASRRAAPIAHLFLVSLHPTMNRFLAILLALPTCAFAQDASSPLPELVTITGKHYKQVVVNSRTVDTVSFTHAVGVATLPWADIPDTVKPKLGYDAAKIAEAKKQQAAQANASAAAVTDLQLSPFAAQYKAQLENKLASTASSPVSDIAAARQFLAITKQLVPKMSEHAQLIMAKWVEVSRQLGGSGLSDGGVERVFLKQFSQEDTLSNVQFLNSARALKDQLVASKVPGSERVTSALLSLFSAYASLCERDRTPSADPAEFIRDLRTEYEFFGAALVVFADQLKSFAGQVSDAAENRP